MASSTAPPSTPLHPGDAWVRYQYIWSVYNAAFLVFLIWVMAIQSTSAWIWQVFALNMLWYIGLAYLDWKAPQRHIGLLVIYMLLGIGLWVLLAYRDPIFFSMLCMLFPAIFRHVPMGWSAVLTGVLAFGWATMSWLWHDFSFVRAFSSAATFYIAGLTLAFFIHRIIYQSQSRQDLVETLNRTRAELAAAERRTGRFEERRRLAGELHDTIAQHFTSVVIHLEAAEAMSGQSSEALKGYLSQAKQAARDGLAQTRDCVWALRPDLGQDLSLDAALRSTGEAWSQEKKIAFEFRTTGNPKALPPEIEELLLRCARECLLNIYKHAEAKHATMTISYMKDECALDVMDDGKGFEKGSQQGGYGLAAMQHAVRSVGGEWTMEGGPGEGTVIAVRVPLTAEAPSDAVVWETS